MTYDFQVTFESNTQPPLTITGAVSASTVQAGCRVAVKKAMSEAKGRRWSSLVVLLSKPEE